MYKKIFSFRIFLLSIVEHIISLYENAPIHKESDYSPRVGGEEENRCAGVEGGVEAENEEIST